ncbi:MAG TPA: LytR C-terminal domain-containing protein [Gaiellaceae bacterium]|nr:LytR C-terminal domain-containing protein [Gaiellaceae bacterium]
MELARPLATEPPAQTSPLTSLRLQRKLTVDEAAKRAALWPEQVEWIEEGKLYRFQGQDTAVLALLRYATSLGIDHREARRLSGMPVEPPAPRPVGRWVAASAALAVVLAGAVTLAIALRDDNGSSAAALQASTLPPPWKISIDVLNGSGDINYTRRVASRVGSFGYRIQHVTRASRFDYRETSVYFEPGGVGLAQRLASQLGGVPVHPLPGGTNKRRLVVIVGPAHATG